MRLPASGALTRKVTVAGQSIKLIQHFMDTPVAQPRRIGGPKADLTGLKVWPVSLRLIEHLHAELLPGVQQRAGNRPLRVLELGAGCGSLGIGLAALGLQVLLTLARTRTIARTRTRNRTRTHARNRNCTLTRTQTLICTQTLTCTQTRTRTLARVQVLLTDPGLPVCFSEAEEGNTLDWLRANVEANRELIGDRAAAQRGQSAPANYRS